MTSQVQGAFISITSIKKLKVLMVNTCSHLKAKEVFSTSV